MGWGGGFWVGWGVMGGVRIVEWDGEMVGLEKWVVVGSLWQVVSGGVVERWVGIVVEW